MQILVYLVMGLIVTALAVPVTAVTIHQRRRRRAERALGYRKKERIRL
jgi:hypothetical protein